MTESAVLTSTQMKKVALKQQLLAMMESKQDSLIKRISSVMDDDMPSVEDYIALAQGILTEVDEILSSGDYESSLFLRNTIKPLKKIRQHAENYLTSLEQHDSSEQRNIPQLQPGMMPVYILIFQQQGLHLNKWSQLLRGLDNYVLGRPIYLNEDDVRRVIRNKLVQDQEAYVKVAVPEVALEKAKQLPSREDRYGNELLTLPAGTVQCQNILEFMHGKKRYYFLKGELVNVAEPTK